jgi:hypothetical protein
LWAYLPATKIGTWAILVAQIHEKALDALWPDRAVAQGSEFLGGGEPFATGGWAISEGEPEESDCLGLLALAKR